MHDKNRQIRAMLILTLILSSMAVIWGVAGDLLVWLVGYRKLLDLAHGSSNFYINVLLPTTLLAQYAGWGALAVYYWRIGRLRDWRLAFVALILLNLATVPSTLYWSVLRSAMATGESFPHIGYVVAFGIACLLAKAAACWCWWRYGAALLVQLIGQYAGPGFDDSGRRAT